MFRWGIITLFLISVSSEAALVPNAMPRQPGKDFTRDGLFEGGVDQGANLEDVRFAKHSPNPFERWVIDFSDAQRNVGAQAPKYQLRYETSEKLSLPDGTDQLKRPARFLFIFRSIQANHVTVEKLKNLVKKSAFVKDIVLYPPIERGDMAMEFILSQDVKFTPHQPSMKEGRVVLDLKSLQ